MKINLLIVLLILLLSSCIEDKDTSDESGEVFRLSGTVAASPGVVIDSDVNDPNASFMANDRLGSAQVIENPVTVVGYLNLPGRGSDGRSFSTGDTRDFFRTSLDAGQVVLLNIANNGVDFDLYLYDENGKEVASSESFNFFDRSEVLIVPESGARFIEVRALSSASLYSLSIGLAPTAELLARAAAIAVESQAEIIPGQAIVRFAPDAAGQQAQQRLSLNSSQNNPAKTDDREQLLTLPITAALSDSPKTAQHSTRKAIKALNNEPGVISAEPNLRLYPLRRPNDLLYSNQWHYPLINLENAWDITTGNREVTIAVLDTGILFDHPDLQGNVRSDGYDFIRDPLTAGDGDGIDPDPTDPGDSNFGESSYHGSHVAGTIAATSNNQQGVAGVCWQCQILPVRVLTENGGTLYDYLQGLRYAAGLSNDSGRILSKPSDIINLSLGSPSSSPSEESLLQQIVDKNIFIVAGAGNDNTSNPFYPAAYASTFSVSAVGSDRQKAPYSNFGRSIDLAAPGGNSALDLNGDGLEDGVLSTAKSGNRFNYQAYDGTSMAAPHVAGVIGLMKSLKPDLTPNDFRVLLQNGAITQDLGTSGRDNLYGYGLIDAYLAVSNLFDISNLPAKLNLSPQNLNLVSGAAEASVQVGQIGERQNIASVSVTSDQNWLTATGVNLKNGLGLYRVIANTSNLSPGRYNGSITFSARASDNSLVDTKILSVNLQVFGQSLQQGGQQYLVLLNADDYSVADSIAIGELRPSQNFVLEEVLPGDYFLYVGSDFNNDNSICDPGEFCGAYPFLDPLQIQVLKVNSNLRNLNFFSSFNNAISGLRHLKKQNRVKTKNVAQ
jgi:serine protease